MANDTELCECLVEQQSDNDEQPNTDNAVEFSVASPVDIRSIVNPQATVANVDNTENTVEPIVDPPMDCSDCDNIQSIVDPQATVALPTHSNDPLISAMYKLETVASQNGFIIHDVPAELMATVCLVLLCTS